MIDLTLLDASASRHDFTVGMSGEVTSTKTNEASPYHVPFPFRMPHNTQRRMAEIAISEYTVNSMLYQAHRDLDTTAYITISPGISPNQYDPLPSPRTATLTQSYKFAFYYHVDSSYSRVGPRCINPPPAALMKYVYQIKWKRWIATKYPGRTLEIIIRTTQPPLVTLRQDEVIVSLQGRCLFFLEGTRQKVGVIPFSIEAIIRLQTVGSQLRGSIAITKLTFNPGVEFFGLTVQHLDGLRKSTKKALENMINGVLNAGIPLTASYIDTSLRLSAIHVSIAPGAALLQANVDLYSSFYNHN
ncbi:hypothetical protein OSTOST_15825 [Ostertagia ostertagi]